MRTNYTIMGTVLIITIILGVKIPKHRMREALIAFLALQAITEVAATMVVQFHIIEFPVRLFMKATRVNMLFEFLFYPMIFTWFYLTYNKTGTKIKRLSRYMVYVSLIVWFIFLIERHTELIEFSTMKNNQQVIRLYISFFIEFWIANIFTVWFLKGQRDKKGIVI